ncbi:DUF4920 domain-containing protein [Cytophaga sp. FL35]|uniref:DUF4920 domain-containing protein n=1 Tax=Cytophaga sp. FL35 TaxID=1904456 RepID=UPI001653A84C|nr:DUF4920 domain-containing protein [Cytophaga sp. FL35]MBC6998244.1 DUF4920 domain-containing protein [Cytophaga sp. FL35]
MKRFNTLLVFFMLIVACKGQEKKTIESSKVNEETTFKSFGEEISSDSIENVQFLASKYEEMVVADTLEIKFKGTVTDVCKVKGCWMKVQLPEGKEAMVRFKDYGFFMPNDITGKEVVINGFAFVESMSVEDQKHYAKDAGKSADEIAQITSPLKSYGFEADGVLVPVKQ